MRRAWVTVGLVGLGGLARVAGCSLEPCLYGYYPFDQQTAVPLDVVVTLTDARPFPPDLPAVGPGITLVRVEGGNRIAVDYTVRVDRPVGVVELIPDQPLEPDAEYEVSGIDRTALNTPHSMGVLWRESRTVHFFTGSAPTVLHAGRDYDSSEILLVLSEPVDLADVEAALSVVDGEGNDVPASVTGLWEDEPHIVRIEAESNAYQVQLVGFGDRIYIQDQYVVDEFVDWYRSMPVCNGYLGDI